MPPIFVGMENYVRLAEDGFFRRAVANSFIFTFGSVIFKLLLGMIMALVLTTNVRFRAFWTGVLLIPWVAPTVVSALNFLWIFDGSLGVLNYLLVKVFHILPQGVGWLSEPGTAMASVIGVNVWRGFPFFGISFLAGMKAIPGELNDFGIVYLLTKGGPGGATMVLPVLTYETAFGAQRLGEAIAVALYLLPALAITIMVLARYMRKGRAK
jgi:multiple sugar transport system permease protein